MRVGVKETVFEDLFQVSVQQTRGHLGAVDPGSADRLIIGDLDGLHVFQQKHPARAVFTVDTGDLDARIVGLANLGAGSRVGEAGVGSGALVGSGVGVAVGWGSAMVAVGGAVAPELPKPDVVSTASSTLFAWV